jgi:hypothetical protein
MAISYLGSVTGVAGGSLSLTSLGLQEDDFLFAIQVQDTGTTVTPISGWTNYFDEPRVNVKLVEDYLVCGSSPPTSVTVSGDSSTSVIIAGFRGVDPAAPFDTTSRTALGEDNANLNPPSITTIGDNSYVIAVGGLDDDLVESNVTAPTGYTLVAAKEAGGGQTAMMAYKEVSTAGVEDPGTFGIGSGNDDWIARTHSLRAEGVNPPWTLIDEVTEEIAPGAGNATVNLPTSAEGDIVVFILGTDSGLSTPAITDSGWNLEQFSDDECCIGWKVMGSTPDTTVTVPRTLDRYAAFAAQAYRGGDGTQPDAALQTAIGSSSVPDPPSITTATDDALVIAFGQLDDEVITFTAPSGYGRLVEANTPSASSPGNDGASVVIASRRVPTAGTENPGTFAAIQNDNWYGATIAFTLAVGGGTTLPENVEAARSRKRKKRIEDERKQREALRRAYEEVTGEAEPQVAAVPQEVRQEVVEAAVTRIADDWQAPNFDFDAQFAKIEALFVQIEAEARQREQQEATRRRRERDAIAVLLMVA